MLRRIYYEELGLPPPADDGFEQATADAEAAGEVLTEVVGATADPVTLAE